MPIVVAYRKGGGGASDRHRHGDRFGPGSAQRRAVRRKTRGVASVRRQPGANVIETVDRVKALLPVLQASIPRSIDLEIASDSTTTIRASLREVERTLLMSVTLVILVVFSFCAGGARRSSPRWPCPSRSSARCHHVSRRLQPRHLSLMALTIATGSSWTTPWWSSKTSPGTSSRHLPAGSRPAGRAGSRLHRRFDEHFAHRRFVPILLMGGVIGRLSTNLRVTLSAAILVSLGFADDHPMMCARVLRPASEEKPGRLSRFIERQFTRLLQGYDPHAPVGRCTPAHHCSPSSSAPLG